MDSSNNYYLNCGTLDKKEGYENDGNFEKNNNRGDEKNNGEGDSEKDSEEEDETKEGDDEELNVAFTPSTNFRDQFFSDCYYERIEAMQSAIAKHGAAMMELRNKYGLPPLIMAAYNNKLMSLDTLLAWGASPDIQNNSAETALQWASSAGHTGCTLRLLEAGASTNIKNQAGKVAADYAYDAETKNLLKTWDSFPLLGAVARGNCEEVQCLLVDGASINVLSPSGKSAMHLAVKNNHVPIVTLLVQYGADTCVVYENGETALHLAVKHNNEALMTLLLENRATPNAADQNGETALHLAVKHNNEALSTKLLQSGSDVNIKFMDGKSILDFLLDKKDFDFATLVLSNGADHFVATKDGNGILPIDKANFAPLRKDFLLGHLYNLSRRALSANHFSLLFYILQVAETDVEGIGEYVVALITEWPDLVDAKDAEDRTASSVATVSNKKAINRAILIHGRYRIVEQPIHQSNSTLVYKAVDEGCVDEDGKSLMSVALKFTKMKYQFEREVYFREQFSFVQYLVMGITRTHTPRAEDGSSIALDDCADEILTDFPSDSTITKKVAESMFCLVLPLAESNLLVAMIQDRFRDGDYGKVRHMIKSMVECLDHIHGKGVIHADLKPLNVMRTIRGDWLLTDLDAACEIGKDTVGPRSSSAFLPPEAIYVTNDSSEAVVRSVETLQKYGEDCELLVAHSTCDIWSLGCLLYQLLNKGGGLFRCGQDDNLSSVKSRSDNLFVLADWSDEVKDRKLSVIEDPLVRNLLSRILMRDPLKRLTLGRILAHPFMSGKNVVRLPGDESEFDIFISYRVASDAAHAVKLYDLLTAAGVKVWLDSKCLKPGQPWQGGFGEGLLSSRCFVCLMSQEANNHPTRDYQNFSKLTLGSNCDNVFLEIRLSLELRQLGCLEGIFPILIGKPNGPIPASSYAKFDFGHDLPSSPDTHVIAVEEKLRFHMDEMALGSPVVPNRTVKSVMTELMSHNGAMLEGDGDEAFARVVLNIRCMLAECAQPKKSTMTDSIYKAELDAMEAELKKAKEELAMMLGPFDEIATLKASLAAKDTELTEAHQTIAAKDSQLVAKDQQVVEVMQVKEAELKAKDCVIAAKDQQVVETRKQLEETIQAKDLEHQAYRAQVEGLVDRLKRVSPHTTVEEQEKVIAKQEAGLKAVEEELDLLRSQLRRKGQGK